MSTFERLDIKDFKEHPNLDADLTLSEVIRDSHTGAYFFVCRLANGEEFLQVAPSLNNGTLCLESGLSELDWICSKQKDYFTKIGYKGAIEGLYVTDGECCCG